ncbi:MAG: enoyl-CoA hydratase [Acidimicrobiales bacterium]|nr:MAG: enoyl-CoA hydratase [Acidimicrobiales bacterium]
MTGEAGADVGDGNIRVAETDGGVAEVVIDRPERRNALSWEMVRRMREVLGGLKEDPGTRVVVIKGAGDRAFCAGVDLAAMAPGVGEFELHNARGELAGLFEDLWSLGKPTVAAVRGFALAGGFGLALSCDLVVAADDAVFGTPEIDVGLWPYMITVPMLRSMPPRLALELMMTGRRMSAEEAERKGVVNLVVPADRLDDEVGRLASTLAAKSSAALALGRDSFYAVLDAPSRQALRHLQAALSVAARLEDAAEGIAAFREKRAPSWHDR